MQVFRCQTCKGLFLEPQAVHTLTLAGNVLLTCPQDETMLVDATHTPRGVEFLERESQEVSCST